jgi:hypothetical protein
MKKTSEENNSKTEEQIHYENLRAFFNWAISITGALIAIIVSVSLFFTYNSMKDFREELKSTLADSKAEIKEMVSNANMTLKETRDQSDNVNNIVKENSEKSIDNIENESQRSITEFKDYAKSQAISETEKRINEAFKDNNIQKVIDETAKNEIEGRVKDLVINSLKKIPDFILAVDKIRAGDRKSFCFLDSIAKNSNEAGNKNMARNIIEAKILDYENSIEEIKNLEMIGDYLLAFYNLPSSIFGYKINYDSTETSCRKLFNDMKEEVEYSNDLNMVALAFKVLRFLTNTPIRMFDFDEAKKLKYKEGIPHPQK